MPINGEPPDDVRQINDRLRKIRLPSSTLVIAALKASYGFDTQHVCPVDIPAEFKAARGINPIVIRVGVGAQHGARLDLIEALGH